MKLYTGSHVHLVILDLIVSCLTYYLLFYWKCGSIHELYVDSNRTTKFVYYLIVVTVVGYCVLISILLANLIGISITTACFIIFTGVAVLIVGVLRLAELNK